MTMQLLKISGNDLEDPAFRRAFATAVAGLSPPLVIVHGGGRAIADLQSRLGLPERKVEGLRVTDAASLDVAQMVLSGHTNKQLVAALLAAGVRAVGLSGVDGGLLQCVRRAHPTADLGFVGRIVDVDPTPLWTLLAQGYMPVVSPISVDPAAGQVYNVNADDAAAALAGALGAAALTFVSNVPGVLDGDGRLLPTLTADQTEKLIENGVIHGGMVPKVRAALAVLGDRVPRARIVDLPGLAAAGIDAAGSVAAGTVFELAALQEEQL